MKLNPNRTDDFGYLHVEDVYSDEELQYIWNEISHIDYVMDVSFSKEDRENYSKTHNAVYDGEYMMSGFGLGLDGFYARRDYSAMLNLNIKIMSDSICQAMMTAHPANFCYDLVNKDFTLLNKYVPGQKYKRHNDISSFSAVTFFSREKIDGGEFEFSDYDIKFECKNNSCVIFPSWVFHNTKDFKEGVRYSLAQFMVLQCNPPVHRDSVGKRSDGRDLLSDASSRYE